MKKFAADPWVVPKYTTVDGKPVSTGEDVEVKVKPKKKETKPFTPSIVGLDDALDSAGLEGAEKYKAIIEKLEERVVELEKQLSDAESKKEESENNETLKNISEFMKKLMDKESNLIKNEIRKKYKERITRLKNIKTNIEQLGDQLKTITWTAKLLARKRLLKKG
jgi:hypothetical protein